jgi:predicted nucleotidyltransferase
MEIFNDSFDEDFDRKESQPNKIISDPDLDTLENCDIIFDEIIVHLEHVLDMELSSGIKVLEVALVGSRVIGNYRSNSDIDILIEYTGNIGENDLFVLLNNEALFFEDYRIDYIPLQIGRYGPGVSTIDKWIEQHTEYNDIEINRMLL